MMSPITNLYFLQELSSNESLCRDMEHLQTNRVEILSKRESDSRIVK